CRPASARVFAQRECEIETHGLAGQGAQRCLDPAGVLSTDAGPLETVGHADRHGRAGIAEVRDLGIRQGPDPGVELLVGQLGGEALAAALPEVGAHMWRSTRGKPRIVSRWRRPPGTYPQ